VIRLARITKIASIFGETNQRARRLDEFAENLLFGAAWRTGTSHYNPDVEVVTRNILLCLRDSGAACGS